MSSIETIRKINKNIVHENGAVDSFDKQLIQLMSGTYDTRYPMIISEDSSSLEYISGLPVTNALTMNVSTIIKLRMNHRLDYAFISDIEQHLKDSVMAFDSYQYTSSVVVVLNQLDDDENHIIAICRYDKDTGGGLYINEITSVYGKERFESMIKKSYELNKQFYKNEKTEQFVKSAGLQLPLGLTTALSSKYIKPCFTKSQVEADIVAEENLSKNAEINIDDL